MNFLPARNPGLVLGACVVGIGLILLVDILVPLDLDLWLLYAIPVLLSLGLRPRRIFHVLSIAASGLILLVPLLDGATVRQTELASRVLGLAIFWTLALLLRRRRAENDAAHDSAAALSAAQRVAHVGSWWWDVEANRVTWSQELYRIMGLAPADAPADLNQFMAAAIHPEDRVRFEDAARAVQESRFRAGEVPPPLEYRILRPDGTVRYLHAEMGEVGRDRTGRIVAASGIVQDITERKQSESQLVLLGSALAATGNAVMITDAQAAIQWVNPAFTRTTGYTMAEVIGQNPRLLKSGQHPPAFYAEMWRTLTSGQTWTGELINVRKDGALFTEQATINPVHDGAGRITHYVAVSQDITDRKSLEKQVIQTQRLESIGLLASGVAHDLNNIIAPISLSIEVLRTRYPGEQKYLDLIEQCTRRGADIVRQVLTFSRGMDGTRVPLRLSRLVKEVTNLMQETLPRNIDVSYEVTAPQEPEVRVDPTQIHQVLLNLAVNARDAMPQGGRLTLTLAEEEWDDAAAGRVPGSTPGRYMVLKVSDTGTGIPPEILPLIFDPFFSTKQRGQGTGLGLSTVHGIVRSHGGFIQVETALGVGTTFVVHLPVVAAAEAPAPKAPERIGNLAGHGRLVLVVDDEDLIREVTQTVLQKYGFTTVAASSGEEALDVFRTNQDRVSIAILDRMMPGMSGESVAEFIHGLAPHVAIFLSTGLVTEDSLLEKQEQLRQSGVRAVLRKPYNEAALVQALREHVDGPDPFPLVTGSRPPQGTEAGSPSTEDHDLFS